MSKELTPKERLDKLVKDLRDIGDPKSLAYADYLETKGWLGRVDSARRLGIKI